MTSIAAALGIGSGIDTAALVSSLTAAARDPKDAAIARKESANTARISAIGRLASGIDSFASSLSTLISGGTLFTQPTSSDASVVKASAVAGGRLGALTSTIEVTRLAQAQTNVSATFASASEAVGQGTLRLAVGGTTKDIVIGAGNDSLAGLAAAINAAGAGVSANVVTDTTGARLVLKGASGAAGAFTLERTAGDEGGIGRFAYGFGAPGELTRPQAAQDAIVRLDGVEVTRPTNSFDDLIEGVKIDLVKAAPGTVVNLGSERPTAAIRSAMSDFVTAYNSIEGLIDEATAVAGADGTGGGALVGDASMRAMRKALSALVTTPLSSAASGPKTLAEIGVKTQRDGSLALDTAALDKALADDPAGVEALFNPGQRSDTAAVGVVSAYGRVKPGQYALADLVPATGGGDASGTIAGQAAIGSGSLLTAAAGSAAAGLIVRVTGAAASATITVDAGLGGALQAIRDGLRGTAGALTTTSNRLATETKALASERTAMEARIATYKAQLEKSFTAMEQRMTLLKATQTQLTNQIAQWNKTS